MNMKDAPQRIRWGIVAFLIGLAIVLSILDSTGNLEGVLAFVRNPLIAVLDWTAARTDSLAGALSGPRDLQEARAEIDRLQARVNELERENEELRGVQGEAQLLLDLFNRARQTPELTRITAAVIGQDTNPAIRSIIIDKGQADGVMVGMPVEGARGLVGRVFRTAVNSSQVVLITDSASAIPARLGTSRAAGILRGGGLGGSMIIDWLDLKYQIEIGEVVATSGLGGDFPQNIAIGRVTELDRSEAELFQRAVVQPAVDFEALEIVFVITNFQPVETDIFSDLP
ncbi:MAG: rod shape-determining protein MreC [Ardenticatenaceae bacterium]|nr:rod shape-determining protein MreC [Anaerolineales bacterium]MCB8923221.1 rod shape-determining protein MreC [Ardenticatenaceae bacterium]MCB9004834.1 rod shape-determining protein MreC [Ardenticatenaceae bacterium]